MAAGTVVPLLAGAAQDEPGWKIQYFYDKDNSSFTINDLHFFSARRGVAVGYIETEKGKAEPMSVVTGDGGVTWTEVPLKEVGLSVFSLNDTVGWLVTDKGIWKTVEAGRNWVRLKKIEGINRVWFLDEMRGFAVGAPKIILETTDGGKNWNDVDAAEKPKSNAHYTSYDWITFASSRAGLIVGASVPPRPGDAEPAWLDPEGASKRREWPSLTITLESHDSGKNWNVQTAPTFGQTTRVRLLPDGAGLVLIRFGHAFEYPSEVYKVIPQGKSERVYRAKDRVVTDCNLLSPGEGVLAAIEPPGRLQQLPIPGKLHMLYSKGLASWSEMEVPYKANGTRAMLSVADPEHAWVATDTGMILQLNR
jgi:photosystem II stability/assembly factor-like uncharacterized protein